MKHVKKLVSLLLAIIMVFAVATTTFAAGTNSITVNGAQKDETYKLYKMLDLSVNEEKTAYSYTVNNEWNDFFTTGAGKDYVDIDTQGYVTWKAGKNTASDMEVFAKDAAAFASANSLTSVVDPITPTEDEAITFNNLDSGYYLITSTNGTLAIVDTTTTNSAANVYEKNADSTLDKKVQEDSQAEAEGNGWGTGNSAQIGDTVYFQVSITLKKGAKNVVMHDKMGAGLTFSGADNVAIAGLTKGTDYTVVTTGLSDGCVFEIRFTQTYLGNLADEANLIITYSAVLNENADITDGEKNDAKLTWGKNSYTEWSETVTKTFMFDIIKTDSSKKVLNGAKFELYDAQTAGNKIDLVKGSDGVYRVATAAEKSAEGFTSAVIEAGKATVKGLDANTTYWLEETEAPAGYNKLAGRVEVKIENSNLTTNMTGDIWGTGDGGVQITNNTGSLLPSTGGMGTTIFYVVGSILVIGAAVLLITRKRMSNKR